MTRKALRARTASLEMRCLATPWIEIPFHFCRWVWFGQRYLSELLHLLLLPAFPHFIPYPSLPPQQKAADSPRQQAVCRASLPLLHSSIIMSKCPSPAVRGFWRQGCALFNFSSSKSLFCISLLETLKDAFSDLWKDAQSSLCLSKSRVYRA